MRLHPIKGQKNDYVCIIPHDPNAFTVQYKKLDMEWQFSDRYFGLDAAVAAIDGRKNCRVVDSNGNVVFEPITD